MALKDPYAKLNHFSLVFLSLTAMTFALVYTKPVLIPFVFALFFYAVFAPIIDWLSLRAKLPRVFCVLGSLFLVFLIVVATVLLISNSLEEFLRSANLYKNRVIEFLGWSTQKASTWGIEIDDQRIKDELKNLPVFELLQTMTGGIASFLSNAVLTLIFFLFLILGKTEGQKKNRFFVEVRSKVSQYIGIKFGLSLLTGFLTWGVLMIIQVELALMFGVLAFLLNFIPSVGSIIAVFLPLPIALLQFGPSWQVLALLLVTGVIQMGIGNGLEPKLMGESLDLHPVAVLIFLMFWGMIWGVPGMFMAVPITAIFKIILDRMPSTRPFAEFLAGRV